MKVWIVNCSTRPASGFFLYDVYASDAALDKHLPHVNWSFTTNNYREGYGEPYHYVADEQEVLE